jgi:hypothetical protein
MRLALAMTALKRQAARPSQKHVVMPDEKAPQGPHFDNSFRKTWKIKLEEDPLRAIA